VEELMVKLRTPPPSPEQFIEDADKDFTVKPVLPAPDHAKKVIRKGKKSVCFSVGERYDEMIEEMCLRTRRIRVTRTDVVRTAIHLLYEQNLDLFESLLEKSVEERTAADK
jgi:hypothetical protein